MQLTEKELIQKTKKAVQTLPDDYRTVILLYYYANLSYNDDRLEELIRKAVQDDKEPDFNEIWVKIEHKTKVVENQHMRKNYYRKAWFKVAAFISAFLIVFIIIGSTARIGETFPFLFPFHRLVKQLINDTQLIILELSFTRAVFLRISCKK